MADEADMADERQQVLLDAAINATRQSSISMAGNGICIECGGIVKPVWAGGKPIIGRWCGTECRDRWETGR